MKHQNGVFCRDQGLPRQADVRKRLYRASVDQITRIKKKA